TRADLPLCDVAGRRHPPVQAAWLHPVGPARRRASQPGRVAMTTPTPEPTSEQPVTGKPSRESTPPPADKATADQPKGDAKPAEDKPLGPNGEKALQTERELRKQFEQQVAKLKPLEKLAEALGVEPGKTQKS